MWFDAVMAPATLQAAGPQAAAAEALGLDGVWTSETQHDPFLPLGPAALATRRVTLGTAIAVAFPRSPTITAQTAWDLAAASEGRFVLGLGTQVKAHIERRFGLTWEPPVARLRDYIGAVRAVWHTWQTGERLRYEGDFYTLKLMTPFFSPPPLTVPPPPIYIAGVNAGLCRLAGEICDGFQVHPLHTVAYLRDAVLPWIAEGLALAGRPRPAVQVCTTVFVIAGTGPERAAMREAARRQIAFYASTPSYAPVLAYHGWEAAGPALNALAGRGRWDEMGAVIDDSMLAAFAVEGDTFAAAARAAQARYAGLADRVGFYLPFVPGQRDAEWAAAAAVFHAAE